MKVLIEGDQKRYEKFFPDFVKKSDWELVFCPRGSSNQELLEDGADAQVFLLDAISKADAELIERMPNLKLIHSEGVAFNGIDLDAASERGIYVCNNKGCNASAVAEQAILLMLNLLRMGVEGDQAVREGKQIEMKEAAMVNGIQELGECKVGFVGFGDIAKATAKRLDGFGCELYYTCPDKKSRAVEETYQVSYLPLFQMAETCDIISIHCSVTKETKEMIDADFLNAMKSSAYLINTARGEVVNNIALRNALTGGKIAGAGLDTIDPEPVKKDHPLVDLPKECKNRIVYSPHLGGITTGSFSRAHQHMWANVKDLSQGERPDCVVNGL